MPKIQTGGYTIQVPGASSERVSRVGVADRGVTKARPQRTFEGEGSYLLAQGLKSFSQGLSDIGGALAKHESNMLKTKVDDASLDAKIGFDKRYADEVASLRGKDAGEIFDREVETVKMSRESFLEKAGDNSRLRNLMAQEYDRRAEAYLNKVLAHKIAQDEIYRQEVEAKSAITIQRDMSTFGLQDINLVMEKSKELEAQIDDPNLELGAKIAGWGGWFKFNAKNNPDLAQAVYDRKEVQKNVIGEIGAGAYANIQKEINAGREIHEHNIRWRKYQENNEKIERNERHMTGIFHKAINGDLTADYIDNLQLDSSLKITALSLMSRLAKSKDDVPLNVEAYHKIREEVSDYINLGLTPDIVSQHILGATGKYFDSKIAKGLIDQLANRNRYDSPVIRDTRTELKQHYLDGDMTNTQYFQAINDLDYIVRKYEGKPEPILKYVNDVLNPRIKTAGYEKLFEAVMGVSRELRSPAFIPRELPYTPYMTDQERETANRYIESLGFAGKTIDSLSPDKARQVLTDIRSEGFQQ